MSTSCIIFNTFLQLNPFKYLSSSNLQNNFNIIGRKNISKQILKELCDHLSIVMETERLRNPKIT